MASAGEESVRGGSEGVERGRPKADLDSAALFGRGPQVFREKPTFSTRILILATIAILAAVVFAAAATVWLVVETRREQRTIAECLRDGSTLAARDLETLPGELRWQLAFSVLVLFVLLAAAIALVRVFRAFLVTREATGRAMMEERLRRMERFKGLETLAAGLHHEISNPLSALSLYVQLLEEQLEGDPNLEVAKSLAVLKTEVARIGGVLGSLRDFASVQELNRSEADLAEIVDRTVRLIRPQAERQNVQVTVEPSGDGLPHVSVDVTKLEQVLLNVALNGLDAMPEGGKLTIRLSQAEGQAHVDIADTGPGIPRGIRGQVFDPYFTSKSERSGMGLAISDKIIRQHGGRIDFETGPEGTVFRLSLPMENSDE